MKLKVKVVLLAHTTGFVSHISQCVTRRRYDWLDPTPSPYECGTTLLYFLKITSRQKHSSCKGTGLSRREWRLFLFVCFQYHSVDEANGGSNNSRSFTVDDLPVDPSDAHLNGETSNDNFTSRPNAS